MKKKQGNLTLWNIEDDFEEPTGISDDEMDDDVVDFYRFFYCSI